MCTDRGGALRGCLASLGGPPEWLGHRQFMPTPSEGDFGIFGWFWQSPEAPRRVERASRSTTMSTVQGKVSGWILLESERETLDRGEGGGGGEGRRGARTPPPHHTHSLSHAPMPLCPARALPSRRPQAPRSTGCPRLAVSPSPRSLAVAPGRSTRRAPRHTHPARPR